MEEKTISNQVIRRVLTVPDEEFAVLSVGKLAQWFEMDRYKLSRQFKRHAGMTLEEFLYKERMTRAALLLLAYRDITVKDVSEKIGFCSSDYFIRKFRQFYGIVPGKYREFKTKSSGIGDQWKGVKDRRQRVDKSKIPRTGERRKGPKNRKKLNPYHNDHVNPNMLPQRVLEVIDGKKGNPCEKCYFRLFALNFDDLK
ncbi:MAG: helix-turn-helix transcriptional regulator [Spirochaetes bacterium]|nr:helix-turn-helix transcriptional regulator [Spirochaetota bacterium]